MIKEIKEDQVEILLDLIKQMASYEKLSSQVVATKESLYDTLFIKKGAKGALIYDNDKICGYILYFFNFSSFTGSLNLYIEDIFVLEEYRRNGYGKEAFKYLAKEALANGCVRIDWICLDWNKKGLDFYKAMGAKALNMWVLHRLELDEIKRLAQ